MKKILLFLLTVCLLNSCTKQAEQTAITKTQESPIHISTDNQTTPEGEDSSKILKQNTQTTEAGKNIDLKQTVDNIPKKYLQDENFTNTVDTFIQSEIILRVNEEAIEKGDKKVCDILGVEESTSCKNNVHLSIAIQSVDTKICKNIDDEQLQTACIQTTTEFSAINDKDETKCNTLIKTEDKEICKNKVLGELALKNNDTEMCERITNELDKEVCLANIASN